MNYLNMRKLPAVAQEKRRWQVVGLRESSLTYDAIAAQVSRTRTGVVAEHVGVKFRISEKSLAFWCETLRLGNLKLATNVGQLRDYLDARPPWHERRPGGHRPPDPATVH